METITKKMLWQPQPSSWPTAAIDHNSVRHSNTRSAHNNELTDIQGHQGCSLRSLFRTALNCYDIKHVYAWEKFSRRHVSEEGRSNKPGKNTVAQAVGKNSQNILDSRALVIQRSSEEVTGKVQKYARMDARQFVPYSSQVEGDFISY